MYFSAFFAFLFLCGIAILHILYRGSPSPAFSFLWGLIILFSVSRLFFQWTNFLLFLQYSLGERYGLRIIPGKNSFLVLPNNVSRSSAVGAILHPGGPARSPMSRRALWMGPDTAEESSVGGDRDFLLALSSDEKLLRRLNEFDGAETVSTSGKGTDAKWKLDSGETRGVLSVLAGAV